MSEFMFMSESKFSKNFFLFINTKHNYTIVQLTDFFHTVHFQTLLSKNCISIYNATKVFS